jgi:hypothetical protein
MTLSKYLLILPLVAAAAMTSCVDAGYVGGPGYSSVGLSYGSYNSLPRNYVGNAYYSGGRYYSGGQYQSGAFSYQGQPYSNRYYHNGQYYYGGTHQHYGNQGRPQHTNTSYGPYSQTRGSMPPSPFSMLR